MSLIAAQHGGARPAGVSAWAGLRLLLVALVAIAAVAPAGALAQVTYPPRPPNAEFIVDTAGLISEPDRRAIRQTAQQLLAQRSVPIVVVTIPSLRDHGAQGWTIERYAHNLFDEFGIGERTHNYGILLLVSVADRQARIELGAGYTRERDVAAQRIMDSTIVPRFRRGEYSEGIRAGVDALASMAGGTVAATSAPGASPGAASPQAPGPGAPVSLSPGGGSLIGLLICGGLPIILLLFLLTRAGRALGGGGGGGLSAGPFGYGSRRRSSMGGFLGGMLLGGLMGHTMGRRGSGSRGYGGIGGLGGLGGLGGGSRGGGGFSGGGRSFGGGFSGRGGATGRW